MSERMTTPPARPALVLIARCGEIMWDVTVLRDASGNRTGRMHDARFCRRRATTGRYCWQHQHERKRR